MNARYKGELRHWYIGVDNMTQDRRIEEGEELNPHSVIHFGVSVPDETDREATYEFCKAVAEAMLDEPRIWYGFIKVAPDDHIQHPSQLDAQLLDGPWEHVLDMALWSQHLLHDRSHARDLYWGNIFGKDMTRRLEEAGIDEALDKTWDELPDFKPMVRLHGPHENRAFLLYDDPVYFGRFRDVGSLSIMTTDTGWVRQAATLAATMRRAGML